MLFSGIKKTALNIATRLPLIGRYFRLDEELLQEIEETLLGCDIGVELTEELIENLRYLEKKSPTELRQILKEELLKLIDSSPKFELPISKPTVILVVGVNGTGKTTTIGKLAHRFSKEGYKVLVAAADTFRAAAYEQLQFWANKAEVEFFGNPYTKDPAAVAFDAVNYAVKHNIDFVIIDTAGRIHTKSNLMNELVKVKKVVQKVLNENAIEVWLVIDGNTGTNGLSQAEEFTKAVGVTGIIVTKLDGTAKGGIVLAIHKKFKIPIRFIGIGEKLEDLVPFDPEEYIEALLNPN